MDKDQILKLVANNVKTLLYKEGISVTEIARRCEVSPGTISKIINANMSITLPMAMTIAKGFNVDLAEILKGLTDKNLAIDNYQEDKNKTISAIYNIGIVSINNRRIICIKDNNLNIIGQSELISGLDLAETTSSIMHLINEAIHAALPNVEINDAILKNSNLNLVMQSYEFEDTRHKFMSFTRRYFKDVIIMPDWQITYFSIFKNKTGISLIVDKGVSLSYMKNHSIHKLGGWKFPVYDLGGENWLGVETIKHTIEAAEGYVPMSGLASNVLAKFNGKIEKITEACFKGSKDHDIYCIFTEPLLRAFFTNDKAAKQIIELGLFHINRLIARADEIIEKKNKIAINGSLADIYKSLIGGSRIIKSSSNADKASLLSDIHVEKEKYNID